jgi:hypothetical protein
MRAAAKTRKRARVIAEPMPQIIGRISQEGTTRKGWDEDITAQLLTLWFDRMPLADLKIASAKGPLWLAQMSPEALMGLDEIIVRQAGTLGWRIGLSELVQWRLSEWEVVPDGLKLLRQYLHAVERAARIFQRRQRPPLDDPSFYTFKDKTVKELKVLLIEMRKAFRVRFSDPPHDLEPVLVVHFSKTVKRRSRSFPFLAANRLRWEAFFKDQPTAVLMQNLAKVRLCPASLFDLWFSWCKGVDPERIRQIISHLGSSPRKPTRNAKL